MRWTYQFLIPMLDHSESKRTQLPPYHVNLRHHDAEPHVSGSCTPNPPYSHPTRRHTAVRIETLDLLCLLALAPSRKMPSVRKTLPVPPPPYSQNAPSGAFLAGLHRSGTYPYICVRIDFLRETWSSRHGNRHRFVTSLPWNGDTTEL